MRVRCLVRRKFSQRQVPHYQSRSVSCGGCAHADRRSAIQGPNRGRRIVTDPIAFSKSLRAGFLKGRVPGQCVQRRAEACRRVDVENERQEVTGRRGLLKAELPPNRHAELVSASITKTHSEHDEMDSDPSSRWRTQ